MITSNINLDRKMVFPFYIFLTLLMGYLGVASVRSVWHALLMLGTLPSYPLKNPFSDSLYRKVDE